MTKKIGFFSSGVTADNYMYSESESGKSIAFGFDGGTETFNINTSPLPEVTPDEATSNIAIDPSTNGDLAFQPNGTGKSSFIVGDVNIQSGDLQFANVSGTDGQIPIASSVGPQIWATMTSIDSSVSITLGPNSLDLSVNNAALYNVPGFFAYASVDINNLTGDSTTAFLVCDFVPVSNTSDGSSYNPVTGYFLCMTTGLYLFTVNLAMSGLVVDNTTMHVYLDQGGAQQLANFVYQNPYTAAASSGLLFQSYAITYRAIRGFQYNVRVKISGNASNNVNLLGANGGPVINTTFSAVLLTV